MRTYFSSSFVPWQQTCPMQFNSCSLPACQLFFQKPGWKVLPDKSRSSLPMAWQGLSHAPNTGNCVRFYQLFGLPSLHRTVTECDMWAGVKARSVAPTKGNASSAVTSLNSFKSQCVAAQEGNTTQSQWSCHMLENIFLSRTRVSVDMNHLFCRLTISKACCQARFFDFNVFENDVHAHHCTQRQSFRVRTFFSKTLRTLQRTKPWTHV